MSNSDSLQVGNRVFILSPAYIAGKFGIVCGRELRTDGQSSKRWLIQIDSDKENIVVSLVPQEFQVINEELE